MQPMGHHHVEESIGGCQPVWSGPRNHGYGGGGGVEVAQAHTTMRPD